MLECHNQAAKQTNLDTKIQIIPTEKYEQNLIYICIICSYKHTNAYIFSIQKGFFCSEYFS